ITLIGGSSRGLMPPAVRRGYATGIVEDGSALAAMWKRTLPGWGSRCAPRAGGGAPAASHKASTIAPGAPDSRDCSPPRCRRGKAWRYAEAEAAAAGSGGDGAEGGANGARTAGGARGAARGAGGAARTPRRHAARGAVAARERAAVDSGGLCGLRLDRTGECPCARAPRRGRGRAPAPPRTRRRAPPPAGPPPPTPPPAPPANQGPRPKP